MPFFQGSAMLSARIMDANAVVEYSRVGVQGLLLRKYIGNAKAYNEA